jgi:hypothetical protein
MENVLLQGIDGPWGGLNWVLGRHNKINILLMRNGFNELHRRWLDVLRNLVVFLSVISVWIMRGKPRFHLLVNVFSPFLNLCVKSRRGFGVHYRLFIDIYHRSSWFHRLNRFLLVKIVVPCSNCAVSWLYIFQLQRIILILVLNALFIDEPKDVPLIHLILR